MFRKAPVELRILLSPPAASKGQAGLGRLADLPLHGDCCTCIGLSYLLCDDAHPVPDT